MGKSGRSSQETDEVRDVPEDRVITKAKADQLRSREKARLSITLSLILLIAITLGVAAIKSARPIGNKPRISF
jgi:uncharacterized protein involved in exopolysaccharide biosynthesis